MLDFIVLLMTWQQPRVLQLETNQLEGCKFIRKNNCFTTTLLKLLLQYVLGMQFAEENMQNPR